MMNCKGPWEGYRQQAKSRPLSPSRLPLRAHFHRERERRLGTRQPLDLGYGFCLCHLFGIGYSMVNTLIDHRNDVIKCSKLKWNHEPQASGFTAKF